MTLVVDHRQRAVLEEGTAALYTADRPHRIENESADAALLILVLIEGQEER